MAGPGKDEGGVTRVTQAVSLTKMEGEVAKGFGRGRYVQFLSYCSYDIDLRS